MLRALLAASRAAPSLISSAGGTTTTASSALASTSRAFTSSPLTRGLDELFEKPLKEGETRTAGRAWTATDLRSKSWDDLHALWYVLLKERARLAASADASRAARSRPANPARAAKVRKSMARIKLVLSERAAAHPEPVKSYELRAFVDAL